MKNHNRFSVEKTKDPETNTKLLNYLYDVILNDAHQKCAIEKGIKKTLGTWDGETE